MKRSKRLYLLLGILAVVLVATVGVLNYEKKKEEIKTIGEVVLTIAKEDVTGISWESGTESYAFHKEDGWTYDEDTEFPVDEDELNGLLESIEELNASFVIENVEDYGQYGLENPECTITVETEETVYEILLGDFSTMDSERYVSLGDGNVYLVTEDPMDAFDITISELIAHDEVPDMDEVSSVSFAGAQNYTLSFKEKSSTYAEEDLYYADLDGKEAALDTDRVESYLNAMETLALNDYKTYKAAEEDLETYGLANPELTVTVAYADEDDREESFVLHVGRDPEEAADSDDEDIVAYVRVGESKIIYEITSEEYRELVKASYNDLRHQEVFWADFADVTEIEISLEGESYTVTAEGDDEERTYKMDGEEIETGDLETAITVLTADSFTDQEPDGKEEISLVIRLDDENDPEVSLTFYRYDGSSCLAVVDGEPVCLVERKEVVDLIEAVNAVVL